MNLEEIQKIRLAIETPEHQKEHDNYCFEAEEILNTYELALSKGQALPIDNVSKSFCEKFKKDRNSNSSYCMDCEQHYINH